MAFYGGTQLRIAMDQEPQSTRMALVKMLADLIQFVDAKKTLATTDQITFTADAILHDQPGMTLEEIRMAFDLMKQGKMGKLYERLKTAEVLECLEMYVKEHRRQMLIERRKRMEREEWMDAPPRKLKPLNLAAILDDIQVPQPHGKGLGTQIRERNGWTKDTPQLPCSAHDKEQQ